MKIRLSILAVVLGLLLEIAGIVVRATGGPLPVFGVLIAGGVALLYSVKFLDRREAKRRKEGEERFLAELKGLADDLKMQDPEDELTDLFYLYDERERQDLLDWLQRLPKGLRRLRTVLDQIESEG